jgi:hypothetical protein
MKLTLRFKGGEGSGNFGHEGRPGEVGGSAPSDSGSVKPEVKKGDTFVMGSRKGSIAAGTKVEVSSVLYDREAEKYYALVHPYADNRGRMVIDEGNERVYLDDLKPAPDLGKLDLGGDWVNTTKGKLPAYELTRNDVKATLVFSENAWAVSFAATKGSDKVLWSPREFTWDGYETAARYAAESIDLYKDKLYAKPKRTRRTGGRQAGRDYSIYD